MLPTWEEESENGVGGGCFYFFPDSVANGLSLVLAHSTLFAISNFLHPFLDIFRIAHAPFSHGIYWHRIVFTWNVLPPPTHPDADGRPT